MNKQTNTIYLLCYDIRTLYQAYRHRFATHFFFFFLQRIDAQDSEDAGTNCFFFFARRFIDFSSLPRFCSRETKESGTIKTSSMFLHLRSSDDSIYLNVRFACTIYVSLYKYVSLCNGYESTREEKEKRKKRRYLIRSIYLFLRSCTHPAAGITYTLRPYCYHYR